MLTEKEKSLWMEVYEAGIRISVMEPWFHFSEKDLFIFEDATKKLQLFMIIIDMIFCPVSAVCFRRENRCPAVFNCPGYYLWII